VHHVGILYDQDTVSLCEYTDSPLASNDVKLEKAATAKFEVSTAKHPERPVP